MNPTQRFLLHAIEAAQAIWDMRELWKATTADMPGLAAVLDQQYEQQNTLALTLAQLVPKEDLTAVELEVRQRRFWTPEKLRESHANTRAVANDRDQYKAFVGFALEDIAALTGRLAELCAAIEKLEEHAVPLDSTITVSRFDWRALLKLRDAELPERKAVVQ